MAPLVKAFKKEDKLFETKICVTAQHREMLDQVLELFEIVPDYDLNIMKSGQDLYDITSNVLLGVRNVINDFTPDIIFVHGDTTTTFATSLAAFYQKIKVGHVEAGLRTGDIYSPWPEELNRQLTTKMSTYHFAPTLTSKENLTREGVSEECIVITGNTVIDSLFIVLKKIKSNKVLEENIIKSIEDKINCKKFHISASKIILVTGHRRENFGEPFINICKALKFIAEENQNINIIYPVHLNPNVQKPVYELLSNIPNIHLIEPLQYEEFIYLMDKSYLVITDSGGIQEEAPSLGKPVLVLRDTTERPEAIQSGTVKLVGTNTKKIIDEVSNLISDDTCYTKMSKAHNPYGDGQSCNKIVSYFTKTSMING
jgi:UDP-N-acetylglucosamine 2-epimerase (non-hydrolysing)